MTSFDFEADPKEIATIRFIGQTQRELAARVLQSKRDNPRLSQAQIARMIGTDKSVLTRVLSGTGNITLRKLAEIAWALGLEPKVVYYQPKPQNGQNTSNAAPVTVLQWGEAAGQNPAAGALRNPLADDPQETCHAR